MKQWIIENTNITEEKYDNIIITSQTYNPKEGNNFINTIFNNKLLAIHDFTYKSPNILRQTIYNIQKNNKTYNHKNIKFIILAEHLETLLSKTKKKEIKQLKNKLYSTKRDHKCFELSMEISKFLDNCYITTALCKDPYFKKTNYFLHTFLIIERNNIEYVIDSTFNIIIKKDIYFELFKAKLISKIDKETLLEYLNYIKENNYSEYLNFSEVLCFKDEIVNTIRTKAKK